MWRYIFYLYFLRSCSCNYVKRSVRLFSILHRKKFHIVIAFSEKLKLCIHFQGSSSSRRLLRHISGITAESGNSGIIQQLPNLLFKVLEFLSKKPEPVQSPVNRVLPSNFRMALWKAFNHGFPFVWQELLSEIWPSLLFHVESSFECLPSASSPWRADSFYQCLWKQAHLDRTQLLPWLVCAEIKTCNYRLLVFCIDLHFTFKADADACGKKSGKGGVSALY